MLTNARSYFANSSHVLVVLSLSRRGGWAGHYGSLYSRIRVEYAATY